MAISCWDSFTGHNWERYASVSGVVSMIFCFLFAVMTWVLEYNVGVGVYTFFVGLILIPLETPILDCIRPVFMCKEFFNNSLYFNRPIVKSMFYTALSILMFALAVTPCVGAGIFMLFTSILLIFAQCNQIQDKADEARANGGRDSLSKPLGSSSV